MSGSFARYEATQRVLSPSRYPRPPLEVRIDAAMDADEILKAARERLEAYVAAEGKGGLELDDLRIVLAERSHMGCHGR